MTNPWQMFSGAGDDAAFAQQLQQAVGTGFDPFSLLAGERRFCGVFLAPIPSQLANSITRWLADGTGPLQEVVAQLRQQGASATEAAAQARQMFTAAQGMLVTVLADEQGPSTVPQLFFGHLEDGYLDHVLRGCGETPWREQLRAALLGLRQLAEGGVTWPRLVVAADGAKAATFWGRLAGLLIAAIDEGLFAGAGQRHQDLAQWTAAALAGAGSDPQRLARLHAVAGEIEAAVAAASTALAGPGVEDEDLAKLMEALVDGAIRRRCPELVASFLDRQAAAISAVLGGCYEQALPTLRISAAAQRPAQQLIAAAEALQRADRKAFRHDLNREPMWQVALEKPGELLDTNAAAEHIGRSPQFVAKRLEAGTIPWWRDGEQLRIPVAALDAWKAVMDHFALLD